MTGIRVSETIYYLPFRKKAVLGAHFEHFLLISTSPGLETTRVCSRISGKGVPTSY